MQFFPGRLDCSFAQISHGQKPQDWERAKPGGWENQTAAVLDDAPSASITSMAAE
jgi:hypothetical protein